MSVEPRAQRAFFAAAKNARCAGGWIAEVPSLPGCVSEGATRAEALENVQDAIAGWLSVAEEIGMKVSIPALDHTIYHTISSSTH